MKLSRLYKTFLIFFSFGNQAIAAVNYQFNPELTVKYIKSCKADIYFYNTLFKCDGYTVHFLTMGGSSSVVTIQNSTVTITTEAAERFQNLIQEKAKKEKGE
ncbi:hypothetical protein AB8613_13415 [Vibrio sp. BS-M-Sm-2]|uniref:hypothetical protein n=1 Tax=Vibrio sp. BS-M-Sm-2 TaxID=3241167 RepID=UPI003556090A